jgi:hypothetical protein
MIPLQRSPFDNPLHRREHVEPGTRIGRGKEENAMLSTPLHDAVAFMPSQVVEDSTGFSREGKSDPIGRRLERYPNLANDAQWERSKTREDSVLGCRPVLVSTRDAEWHWYFVGPHRRAVLRWQVETRSATLQSPLAGIDGLGVRVGFPTTCAMSLHTSPYHNLFSPFDSLEKKRYSVS